MIHGKWLFPNRYPSLWSDARVVRILTERRSQLARLWQLDPDSASCCLKNFDPKLRTGGTYPMKREGGDNVSIDLNEIRDRLNDSQEVSVDDNGTLASDDEEVHGTTLKPQRFAT